MASKTDYESAAYIIAHIDDPDIRLYQAQLWATHFATANPRFNEKLFFDAVDREWESAQ